MVAPGVLCPVVVVKAQGGGRRSGRGFAAMCVLRIAMAGMPLFAHACCKKITPPPLSVPLKPIKFCGSETQNRYLRCSGPGWSLPVLRSKTGKNARKAAGLSAFSVLPVCCGFPGFRKKMTHRPPEVIEFLMPVAQHDNKESPPASPPCALPGGFLMNTQGMEKRGMCVPSTCDSLMAGRFSFGDDDDDDDDELNINPPTPCQ